MFLKSKTFFNNKAVEEAEKSGDFFFIITFTLNSNLVINFLNINYNYFTL